MHALSVSVDSANVFCCACNDYIYDADFERLIANESSSVATAKYNLSQPPHLRDVFAPWMPTLIEVRVVGALVRSETCL